MNGATIRRIASVALLLALGGCVHPSGGKAPLCLPCRPGCVAVEANLLERGIINADAPLLEGEVDSPLPLSPDGFAYKLLNPADCQCLAVARANTAHLVDIERRLAISSTPARPRSKVGQGLRVHQQLLAYRAIQIRNEAAGEALTEYYELAAAEATVAVLERSRAHVLQMLQNAHELEERGLPVPLDRSALQLQELDLAGRRAELEWSIARLNGRLRLALGWELAGPVRIWPETDLIVIREPIDVGAAVQTGLSSRADLATLRLLSNTLDEPTLPLVRGALQTQDATLGNVTSGFERLGQLLRPARGEDEMRARRQQLAALLGEKERELTVGIHTLAGAVEMHRDQAVFARRALESARRRLADLEQLRDVNQATPFDVFSQQGKVLEAEATLVEKAVAWRIAEVKLRQAIGVLAWECLCQGGPAPLPYLEEALPQEHIPLPPAEKIEPAAILPAVEPPPPTVHIEPEPNEPAVVPASHAIALNPLPAPPEQREAPPSRGQSAHGIWSSLTPHCPYVR